MKVLMLITGLGVGGAERQVCDLLDAMSDRGVDVQLACLAGSETIRPSQPSIQVINLGLTKSPAGLIAAAARFRALVRHARPDVVHCHLVHANLFGRLMRVGLGIPVVISSAHNTDEEGWWRMLGYRLTDFLADLSTNVSSEAVDAFSRAGALGRHGMRVMYNGISSQRFQFNEAARQRIRGELGLAPDMRLILNVGRLEPPKNHASLITAFAAVRSRRPGVHLVIVGKGALEPSLRAHARACGLTDEEVRFLGVRQDVEALMCAADLFVLSSAWEGFGLVVAEAMACERVVVATDCGGVKEVVGDAGFLVPPRADEALTDAMLRALALADSERCRVGTKARQRVLEKFSLEAAADAWLSTYRELLDSRQQAGLTR